MKLSARPSHALHRTAASRRGCNRRALWLLSLSLGVRPNHMRLLRLFLLLFMGFLLLVMAGCPGLYDSKRRAIAHQHYFDAPSETTRTELEQAKRLDRRDVLVFEFVMAGTFAAALYAFIRAGRKVQSYAA